MSEPRVKISELFKNVPGGALSDCEIVSIAVKDGAVRLTIFGDIDMRSEQVRAEISAIKKAYGLESLSVTVRETVAETKEETARREIGKRFPSLACALWDAKIEADEASVTIKIASEVQKARFDSLSAQISEMLGEIFGANYRINIISEGGESRDTEMERLRAEKFSNLVKELAEQDKAAASMKKEPEGNAFKPKEMGGTPICGKLASGMVYPCSDVSENIGKVTVEGELFRIELREIAKINKTSLTFDIADDTGAVTASKLYDTELAKELAGKLKPGIRIAVQGMAGFNKYENDVTITPSAIVQIEKKSRTDEAALKRVELHLHTNMSAMDAICDPGEVISLAAKMGHPAIAITDHGVVQAYPEAAAAAAKNKIKVLYGIEAYCVDDVTKDCAVRGASDARLDDEIVVFDLETTGLDPRSCEIIEIAASKVAKGERTESYHSYVKPRALIPAKITELTGIRDETVADARSIEEVLPEFLEFIGNCPMCAHNADFDISFLSAACREQGVSREFCSIDTVRIARALMPELPKHRLNNIADAMKLSFNHHRASDDSEVLTAIFIRFMRRLSDECGITRVDEIDSALTQLKTGKSPLHGKSYHFIILVKKKEGIKQLYKLISDSNLKYFRRTPIIPMSKLAACRENFIFGSACVMGELFGAIVEGKPWNELVSLASFYDYLEIQPVSNNLFLIAEGKAKDREALKDFNRTVLKLGAALGKPVCATGDVHYINKSDKIYRDILMSGHGMEENSPEQEFYFRNTDEMLAEFDYLGTDKAFEVVVENPRKIADMCDVLIPVKSGTYPPAVENSARDIEMLARIKVKELYETEDGLPKLIADRLEAELTPIVTKGYDVMYMIAQKLVQKSNSDGYLVGSRGSVGSSFVAFLAGITEVNALPPHYRCPKCRTTVFGDAVKYEAGVDMPDKDCPKCSTKMVKDGFNIPFATFLGFESEKAPDIDLNFSSEYQQRIHNETIRLFGEDRVFKAGTISKMQDKTAYGYVKNYLAEKGITLNKASVNRLVNGCTGVKRTTGQHPGGLIICPHDMEISDFCPVQHPADKSGSDIITTHFDYHSIHDNLLKLDLLGHDDPTMIRKLQDISGIDPRTVPLDDEQTMKIFTDISPLGIQTDDILEQTGAAAIPEFGTKFVRGMLVDTQPHSFSELVRISGLSHGTDVWLNNAQDIIKRGDGTLKDVICVRDDITLHLIDMGIEPRTAFTISEAVRKGKGLKPEWEELMLEHNLPEWYIKSCKAIKYMFPRAHAVAYVTMAFRIAWFKVHRPLDFYCAYFSIRASGFDATYMGGGDAEVSKKYRELKAMQKRTALENDAMSTLEICHEFYKRGFTFLPVDIYKSDIKAFTIEKNGLRMPFTALPGLGETAAASLFAERANGGFMSMEDIVARCDKVSASTIDLLSQNGALEGIPKSNQLDLFEGF